MAYQLNESKRYDNIHNVIKKDPKLWELFTKKEEYNPIKVDEHARFSYQFSNHKDVLYPAVSEYLLNHGFEVEYPNGKKFAVVLTHDIDDIYVKLRHIYFSLINFPKTGNIPGVVRLIRAKLDMKKTPYINFKEIIQIEKNYEAKSSFYFFATSSEISEIKYNLEDLEEEIFYILDEECEVGLHTEYFSFDKPDEIKKEKAKIERLIGKKIIGVRNHDLRFKTPDSWEFLANAGFEYDTSFGYHDIVGFRNGMCHPFQPYNLNKDKKIDILEIPLNIQDWTLFMHMKTGTNEGWRYIKNLIDNTEKYGGVLTILWHNWTFSLPVSYGGIFRKEWTKLYEKILKYCHKKNAWITNGKEICDWYKQNGILKR